MKTINKSKLTGLNDVLFKAIMYPNIHIMKAILKTVLNKDLNNMKYLGQEMPVSTFIEKGKRLDAFIQSTNEYLDIEVSTSFNKYISWRNYAFAAHIFSKGLKRSENYRNYKHTYLINIIGNKKGKIPIRVERHVDAKNEEMTNAITEVQINVDFFIKEYYNKNNQELTKKYKYIIMLGLNLKELKEFNRKYGDKIMNEYEEKMESVLDDEEIEPLFTFKEDLENQVQAAKAEGIEIGEKRGEKRGISIGIKNTKIELAKSFKMQGFPLDSISKATGLSLKQLMSL